jgi:hypothetical protein
MAQFTAGRDKALTGPETAAAGRVVAGRRDRTLDIDWSKLQIADDPAPPESGFRFRSWARSVSAETDGE